MLDTLPVIPLFQDIAPHQVSMFRESFEPYIRLEGEVIFEQGDPALHLYLLISGGVAIRYKPYDTPPIVLTRLRDGDVFGWSAVIGSPRYTSSAISDSRIDAIRIHRKDLWNLLTNEPETGKILIDRLAQIVSPRWKNAHEQIQPLLRSIERK
jgi:CRP-like cAMP-binding protein